MILQEINSHKIVGFNEVTVTNHTEKASRDRVHRLAFCFVFGT